MSDMGRRLRTTVVGSEKSYFFFHPMLVNVSEALEVCRKTHAGGRLVEFPPLGYGPKNTVKYLVLRST